MKQVTIENPVINSPFAEPGRHFRFVNEPITDEHARGCWRGHERNRLTVAEMPMLGGESGSLCPPEASEGLA